MDGDFPIRVDDASPIFLIGITGCPSSGKTTLANTLADIFAPLANEQRGEAELITSLSSDRVAVIHQDDYLLPKYQWPRSIVNADPLKALDWVRLRSDFERFSKGERRGRSIRRAEGQTIRDHQQQQQQQQQQPLESDDGAAEPYRVHRDAIETCAVIQALENDEGGFPGRYFRRAGDDDRPVLGCRLLIMEGALLLAADPERQTRLERVDEGREENVGVGHGEQQPSRPASAKDSRGQGDAPQQDVTGTGERPRATNPDDSPDQRAQSLWEKTLRCIKSPLQPSKDRGGHDQQQQQQHTDANAMEDRDLPDDEDASGQPPRTDCWTLRDLTLRIKKGALFARDPSQHRRQQQQQQQRTSQSQSQGGGKDESESGEDGMWGLDGDELFAMSEGDGPRPPTGPVKGQEGGEHVVERTGPPPDAGPGRDVGRVPARPPGSVYQGGGPIFCDKSTCRFCKGKGVEGRDEHSPCRAPRAPEPGSLPGSHQSGVKQPSVSVTEVGDGLQSSEGPRNHHHHLLLLQQQQQQQQLLSQVILREQMKRRIDTLLFLGVDWRVTPAAARQRSGPDDLVMWAVGTILRQMVVLEDKYRMGT